MSKRVFFIRPFGTPDDINFDRVDQELLTPACEAAGFAGGTTGLIVEQGNIRTDMFEQLIIADLVIADISIHNANVFYELGIRHSLRDKRTILIKSKGDTVPFDLRTDHYLAYDATNPRASVDKLAAVIRATWDTNKKDSPIFQLLPGLAPKDPEQLQFLPIDFQEDVERATAKPLPENRALLQLFFAETEGLAWRLPGIRLIARSQRKIEDYTGALRSWKALRDYEPEDLEANIELSSIFQRLGNLEESDRALDRVLSSKEASFSQRAEIFALKGRNAKSRWLADWSDLEEEEPRQQAALESKQLEESLRYYADGFREDRNHFYSGLNALAMATILTELAALYPERWAEGFEQVSEASSELARYQQLAKDLAPAVRLALESSAAHPAQTRKTDVWLKISQADLRLFTSSKPSFVGRSYREALKEVTGFEPKSARAQLEIYQNLGILKENVAEALKSVPEVKKIDTAIPKRVLLFTGHRMDAEDRETPRFPASGEEQARRLIHDAVVKERELAEGEVIGISGGANGGDILFHEICLELGIKTRMLLAIPREKYVTSSVSDAGHEWTERFNGLCRQTELLELSESDELPRWLRSKNNYSVWERSNLWMLHQGLELSADHLTLIALWNGQSGDGPGGTHDMVNRARSRGAKFIHLDSTVLTAEN